MKAKDFIIIGGAVALFYLYQRNKSKKTIVTPTIKPITNGAPSNVVTPNKVIPFKTPLIVNPLTNGGTTTGGGAIFTGSTTLPNTPSVPEPIFNIELPSVVAPVIPTQNMTTPPTSSIYLPQGGGRRNPIGLISYEPAILDEALVNNEITPIVRQSPALYLSNFQNSEL